MYQTCPKCGYHRQPTDDTAADQCPSCGLQFRKWLKQRYRRGPPGRGTPASPPPRGRGHASLLLDYPEPQERLVLVGRLLLLLILAVWGLRFISMDHRVLQGGLPPINYSFLHGVDLVFHEAGHILFRPFGRFITVLGGSLGQLLMPAVVMGAFLRCGDPFGAAVGLWWLGQSLMDLAPYIYDARRGQMLLLGGVTGQDRPGSHDWQNILGSLGLLDWDHAIAGAAHGLGALLVLAALGWGGWVLRRHWS
jgi:hypothetical protein